MSTDSVDHSGIELLKDALNRLTPDHKLTLQKNWFDSSVSRALFDTVLKSDSLTVTLEDPAGSIVADTHIVLRGAADTPLLGKLCCIISVTSTDSKESVTFDASVETLAIAEEIFPWLDSSLLRAVHCSSCNLNFSSESPEIVTLSGNKADPFASSVVLSVSLINESSSLSYTMKGPLGIPGVDSIKLASLSGTLKFMKGADFAGELNAVCTIGTLSIPVSIPVPSSGGDFAIRYRNEERKVFEGLGNLVRAFPEGDRLMKTLEPVESIIQKSGLALTTIEIGLNSQSLQPQRFSFGLGFLRSWELTGSISLADPQIILSLTRDLITGGTVVESTLFAKLSLGSTTLRVGATLPDPTIFCYLEAGQKVPLADIAGSFRLEFGGFPDISLTNFRFAADITAKSIDLAAGFSSDISFDLGGAEFTLSETAFRMRYADGKCSGSISGEFSVDGAKFTVNAASSGKGWIFKGETTTPIHLEKLCSSLLSKTGITVHKSLPDIEMSGGSVQWNSGDGSFDIRGKISSTSSIDLGITALSLKELDVEVHRKDGKTTGTISGSASVGSMSLMVKYDLTKGPIINAELGTVPVSKMANILCGSSVFSSMGLPVGFPDFELKNCSIAISSADKSASVSADLAGYGSAVFAIKKGDGGWGFVLAAVIGPDFRFGNLLSVLNPIDNLKFQGSALVVSSTDISGFRVPNAPELSGDVTRGLNFLMNLSMTECVELNRILELLKLHIDTLRVHMAVGADGDALMEGLFEGTFSLVKGITLTRTGLKLRIQSGNIKFCLFVKIKVDIGGIPDFVGEISVEPNGASMSASLVGSWVKPFGVNGLTVSDVSISGGVSAECIPSGGIAGKVKIRDFEGELGVLFNSQAPQQSALKLHFDELHVRTILDMCDRSIANAIPHDLDVVLDSGYENVDIHVVPTTTQIGEVKYERGFRARGSVDLLGWSATTNMEIDPSKGITASGKMDSLDLLGIFKFTGSGDRPNPELQLVARLDEQKALVAGAVSFLGLNGYAISGRVSSSGILFSISEKLWGVLETSLKDCSLDKNGFRAAGEMKFGIKSIGPIKVAGVTVMDKININTILPMGASLEIGRSFSLDLKGSLTIAGYALPQTHLNLKTSPGDLRDAMNQLIDVVNSQVSEHFTQIWKTVEEWAKAVRSGFVTFSGDVAGVASSGFHATKDAAVAACKILDKGTAEVYKGLMDAYRLSETEAATVLNAAKYSADQIADVLRSVYGFTDKRAAEVLKGAGYRAGQVGDALKTIYKLSTKDAGKILEGVHFAADDIKKWGGDAIDWIADKAKEIIDWFKRRWPF